jgi:hypothetical protein
VFHGPFVQGYLPILSVHERVDRYLVDQHPLVSRVMKGIFNLRPPQPRYEATGNMSIVLGYLQTLRHSEALPLRSSPGTYQ